MWCLLRLENEYGILPLQLVVTTSLTFMNRSAAEKSNKLVMLLDVMRPESMSAALKPS
jgi:hypothetical protein